MTYATIDTDVPHVVRWITIRVLRDGIIRQSGTRLPVKQIITVRRVNGEDS